MKRSALTIALLLATTAASAAPWTYRGTLNDAGKPANGSYDLRVTLLNQAKTTTVYGPITLYAVKVVNGNFAAELDFGTDLNAAPAMALKTEVQQGGSGFVALGDATPFDPKSVLAGVCWDTTGNAGTNPATNFIGTTDNQPLVLRANNLQVLRISQIGESPNIVAGADGNSADSSGFEGQVIAGGGAAGDACGAFGNTTCLNSTLGSYATVSGGVGNTASDYYSTVDGGRSNTASGISSTVGGGEYNTASGHYSTAGGDSNTASGQSSTVGGGSSNNASEDYSAVVGGYLNTANGYFSTVGGGSTNCAGGKYSWAGGLRAKVRPGGMAPATGACTGLTSGPGDEEQDGDNGTFVWADDQGTNVVSTGPRQFLVRAQGGMAINTNTPTANAALTVNGNVSIPTASVNMGSTTRQMINLFEQAPTSFGIGVQTGTLYNRVNASGGFAWFQGGTHDNAQNNPGTGGTVRMSLDAVGQLRTTTGTIATTSDARLKKNVTDYTGALAQISALRPVHYEYRDAGKSFQMPGRHLGFIAQEVEQVFPEWVSQGDDGYLMLSLRGFEAVAVRGIQELSAENEALKADAEALKAQLAQQSAEFRARLSALEATHQR